MEGIGIHLLLYTDNYYNNALCHDSNKCALNPMYTHAYNIHVSNTQHFLPPKKGKSAWLQEKKMYNFKSPMHNFNHCKKENL